MEKYMTLTVDQNMTAQTVEKVLRTSLNLTKKQISRAKFQPGGIMKNGIQCRTTDIVQIGDQIMICIEAAQNASNHLVSFCEDAHPLEILYEDEDILAVNKPAGMLTHPSGAHYADTLSNQVAGYFHKKKISCRIRPVGRLDKETSGIVLFAKNQVAAQRLQAQREAHILCKEYLAVVNGHLPEDSADSWHTITLPVIKVAVHPLQMQAVSNTAKGNTANPLLLPAVTHYCTLYSTQDWSLVSLRLDTGRTHQIRVHMKALGHPLLGDTLYYKERPAVSSVQPVFTRTALHAWKVSFQQPFERNEVRLTVKLPEDFRQIADYLSL